ncbi:hypothetical protein, partial [Desulfovibrio sp.]|uniref:hypothetical protein n=1 Tax=Desulfovibrio sp. TaxID=885 RepID=UPI0026029CD9
MEDESRAKVFARNWRKAMRIAALIQKKKRGRDAVTATLCRCHDWGQYEPMREEGDICSCEAETKKLRLPTPH